MIVLTADQIIEPADRFNAAITHACNFLDAHPEILIAFGVKAASPSTLVGWQKLGDPVAFPGCEVRRIVAFTEKPPLNIAQRFLDDGGYCWNTGQFAWKAHAILGEIDAHLPEATPLLRHIGRAWNTASRDQVLGDVFPKMPTGSIDYRVMQKTSNACSIVLPCSWEDMGTHAALTGRIGTEHNTNVTVGKAVVTGTGNRVVATTDQWVVVATDNITVVITDNTVFVGDANTDMKALVQNVAREVPEIV
jgi:mannose-1-phosphate guanylyltransferase/mannose-1-phosphate guanylyltransferase/mannose-6-phosphate isomerase